MMTFGSFTAFFIMMCFVAAFSIHGVIVHISLFSARHSDKLCWEWQTWKIHWSMFLICGLIYVLNTNLTYFDIPQWTFQLLFGEIFLFSSQEIASIFVYQSQIDKKRGLCKFEFQHALLIYLIWAAGIVAIIHLPYWTVFSGIALIMFFWSWLRTFFPSLVPMKVRFNLFATKEKHFETISNIAPGEYMFKIHRNDRIFLTFLEYDNKEVSKEILETCKKNIFSKYSKFTDEHQEKRQLAEIAYSHLMRAINK